MLYQAGIKPDYVSLYFLYVYMFVYISITGRYEAGLYQYVLYQLVSSRAGISRTVLYYIDNKPFCIESWYVFL